MVETPSEGGEWWEWGTSRVTSDNEGRKLVSLVFVCFQLVLA